jgi:CheY-like chemotaxis protein
MLIDPNYPKTQVPDEFSLQVKQVLEHFYDFPMLNNHALARTIQAGRLRPAETDGQRLRRGFLAAIEELKPVSEAAQKTVEARYFNLINLRYIESETMQQVAHELGISERQAYRDLKRAEESLTDLLWERIGRDILRPAAAAAETQASEEGEESLELQPRPVAAQELIRNAAKAVEKLAEQQQIGLIYDLPETALIFSTDPRLAQQVLISLLSQILQHAPTRSLRVRVEQQGEQVLMSFHIELTSGREGLLFDNPPALQFIRQLNWRLDPGSHTAAASQTIRLSAGGKEPVLLVIDDHPPLIELLRRYLTNTRCQVVGVSDAQEGLRLAAALSPEVILLDVMMPDIDGWEVLQRLRHSPHTAQIPVIICSIFNDPKLAYSLGATALLAKPVQRDQLFEVLKNLNILG